MSLKKIFYPSWIKIVYFIILFLVLPNFIESYGPQITLNSSILSDAPPVYTQDITWELLPFYGTYVVSPSFHKQIQMPIALVMLATNYYNDQKVVPHTQITVIHILLAYVLACLSVTFLEKRIKRASHFIVFFLVLFGGYFVIKYLYFQYLSYILPHWVNNFFLLFFQ